MDSRLIICKEKRQAEPVKVTNVYVGTHEKLSALSEESGVSMVRLIKICVDFALEHAEIVDADEAKA